MKALLVSLLVLVTACGEGRAIFNIDVYSFMAGTGRDTIPYAVLPFSTASGSKELKINLPPGFGKSSVDSVRITSGGGSLINAGGTGNIGFQLYVAADSLGTFNAGALALSVPPVTVTGAQTVPVVIFGDLSAAVDSLFTLPAVWIRLAATGTNTGPTLLSGRMAITALQLRVVLKDKIF
jgi:hypothetical protein